LSQARNKLNEDLESLKLLAVPQNISQRKESVSESN